MSEETSKIWIITREPSRKSGSSGARGGSDEGGLIVVEDAPNDAVIGRRSAVEVETLKQEMRGFLQAMREVLEEADPPNAKMQLDEADPPNAKMQLDEVELSVEVSGEGKVSLLGFGGQVGGKGCMTLCDYFRVKSLTQVNKGVVTGVTLAPRTYR